MNAILSLIFVLGILIFVHELGHFLFAKLFGVRVLQFSLGFGSKIVGMKWGGTEYLIAAVPLGGYVKMYGEQPGEEIAEEEKSASFSHKSVGRRFCIVFGGPLFNLLFAVLVFWMMFAFAGKPELVDSARIGQVVPASVAERAGMKKGDVILAIDGRATTSWEQVSNSVKDSGGKPLRLAVRRGRDVLTIEAVPVLDKERNIFGEETGTRYMLGIGRSEEIRYKEVSLLEAADLAFDHTKDLLELIMVGIAKIVQRVVPASELGGPIRIAELAGQQLEAGWLNLVHFMGLLSINLCVLNLLPIPVLDGGHLVFLGIEAVCMKPLGESAMVWAQRIGIALLGALMILVFYNDLSRIVQRWLIPS